MDVDCKLISGGAGGGVAQGAGGSAGSRATMGSRRDPSSTLCPGPGTTGRTAGDTSSETFLPQGQPGQAGGPIRAKPARKRRAKQGTSKQEQVSLSLVVFKVPVSSLFRPPSPSPLFFSPSPFPFPFDFFLLRSNVLSSINRLGHLSIVF